MNKKKWALLSIGSFICYYLMHKNNFIRYCELVITKDGQICMPLRTSHKNILIDLVREYNGRIPDDGISINELVKMTDSVCVSYENQLLHNSFYSKEQEYAYKALVNNSLIKENITKIN